MPKKTRCKEAIHFWPALSQALSWFHFKCQVLHVRLYAGLYALKGVLTWFGGPSTAELLDATGQMPISQLLSRHRVRWLGHAARKPETTIVNQLLHADSIPGRPRPVGRPHYTWMDGAMQDLNVLGPRLQLDLLRDWPKLALDRELWRGVASRC